MALAEVLLLFLLYLNIKAIRKYLDTNDTNYVLVVTILLFAFFNLWLGTYEQILGRFAEEFKLIMNALPIVIIVAIVHLEGLRKKEEKERVKTREFFSKYVSEKIVDSLLERKDLQLGGGKSDATVVFTDVRGFTSLSEKLDPAEIVELLNGHFDIITEELFKHDGTVLKYIGDATMAVFNAPIKQKNHAVLAVKASIDIQKKMMQYAELAKKEYGVDFSIGIGINTGEVVVGNIGSHRYMDYTIIGDAVNTASRLNGLAERREIVVSESTKKLIGSKFRLSKPEKVNVKGKRKALKVYRVVYDD